MLGLYLNINKIYTHAWIDESILIGPQPKLFSTNVKGHSNILLININLFVNILYGNIENKLYEKPNFFKNV